MITESDFFYGRYFFLIDLPAANAMPVEDFILKHHSYKELLSFLHNRRLLGEYSYSILKERLYFPLYT